MRNTHSHINDGALSNYQKSGPQSSHISPKTRSEFQLLNDKVVKNSEHITNLTENCDLDHAKINSIIEQNQSLQDTIKDMSVRLGLDNGTYLSPVTMESYLLTPELERISTTLHIPDIERITVVKPKLWKTPFSHAQQIGKIFGMGDSSLGQIKNIRQLKPIEVQGKLRYPVNIDFNNAMGRSMGVQALVKFCKKRGFTLPIQYCLHNLPVLSLNLSAISLILRELQDKGDIIWYATNNFMAVNGMERVAPMYTFRTSGMEKPTEYKEGASNNLFHQDLFISPSDKPFESKEFKELKNAIVSHVNSCKEKYNHISEPLSTETKPSKPSYAEVLSQESPSPSEKLTLELNTVQIESKPCNEAQDIYSDNIDLSKIDFIKSRQNQKRNASKSPKHQNDLPKRQRFYEQKSSNFRAPVDSSPHTPKRNIAPTPHPRRVVPTTPNHTNIQDVNMKNLPLTVNSNKTGTGNFYSAPPPTRNIPPPNMYNGYIQNYIRSYSCPPPIFYKNSTMPPLGFNTFIPGTFNGTIPYNQNSMITPPRPTNNPIYSYRSPQDNLNSLMRIAQCFT